MKNLQKIYLSLSAVGFLLGASACSDDFRTPDSNPEGITGIVLKIPDTASATQFAVTRSDEALTRGADAAGEEGEIKNDDLWFFAYSTTNSANDVIQPISVSDATVTNSYKEVTINLVPDTYRMYVVANVSAYLPDGKKPSTTMTEGNLKDITLNFSSSKPLSVANGLPMACKNTEIATGAAGATSGTTVTGGTVTIDAGNCPTVFANMTFLCSKVRYTLLFDRTDFSSAFGNATFNHISTGISNVSNVTKWYSPSAADYDDAFSLTDTPVATEYPQNISKLESEGETLTALAAGAFDASADKMAWQQVLYLPENLSQTDAKKTTLTLNNEVAGVASLYTLVLNSQRTDNGDKDLKRGKFYDIIAKAKNNDIYEISASLVKDWTPEDILVDFTHTYLTIAQTENIEVESLKPFELEYDTDGVGGLGFECKSTLSELPIITRGTITESNGKKVIELKVNNKIDVTKVETTERQGDAEVWLTAGNIKKKIIVHYDITPFFIVTPTERTIAFVKGGDNQTEFEYVTNLGGIRIRRYGEAESANHSSSFNSSNGATENDYKSELNIRVAGDNFNVADDYIIAKETTVNGPKTSAVQTFIVEPVNFPKDEPKSNYQKVITITVQPKMDDFRIYFRAINDYFVTNNNGDGNGWTNTGNMEEFLKETGYVMPTEAEPWKDFWNENGTQGNNDHLKNYNPNPESNRHRIYIYNQKGNNDDWNDPGKNTRHFTKFAEYNEMTSDNNNKGWYYRDLSATATGEVDKINGEYPSIYYDSHYDHPQRGETLLIFHNQLQSWSDTKGEYMAHRVATSNEPGVPLFSYADNIGWYLYDPTRDPVFNCYDDKPLIEDVTYTIYSEKQMEGWYKKYGKWRDQQNWVITIWANKWDGGDYKMNQTKTISGKTYYVNYLQFKCPRGEYDKSIIIKFDGGVEKMLFDGGIFTNNTGTFSNGEWKAGAPN